MRRFLADEQGATVMEYAFFLGLCALGVYLMAQGGLSLESLLEQVLPE